VLAWIKGRDTLDDEDISIADLIIERATDDDIKKVKKFHSRLQSFRDRDKTENEAAFEKRRVEDANIAKWGGIFAGLDATTIATLREDDAAAHAQFGPQFDAEAVDNAYQAVRKRNRELGMDGGIAGGKAEAGRMIAGLREAFAAEEGTADLLEDFDRVVKEHAAEPARLYREVGKLTISKERKSMEAEFKTEIAALREELLADRHANAKDGPGVIPGQVSSAGPMSMATFNAQFPDAAARNVWRKEHPTEYDAMVAASAAG
jgi:hypothetical protein